MSTVEGCSIEQAATRTGVGAHTLRYYERIGLLAPVPRGPGGRRRYTDDDLGWVTFLTLLRQTGMPIRDMQRFVDLTRAGDGTVPQRVALLRAHRDALVERLELLHRHLGAISTKIDVYEGLLPPDACVEPPATAGSAASPAALDAAAAPAAVDTATAPAVGHRAATVPALTNGA